MLVPDSVHNHPCQQPARLGQQSLCEFRAAAAVLKFHRVCRLKHRKKATGDNVARIRRIAASKNGQVTGHRFAIFQLGRIGAVGNNIQAGLSQDVSPRQIHLGVHLADFSDLTFDLFCFRPLLLLQGFQLGRQIFHLLPGSSNGLGLCGGQQRPFVELGTGENARQPIVVFRRDRIELVIVAPCARHRQPEKRAGHGIDTLIPFIGNNLFDDRRGQLQFLPIGGTEPDKSQCWQVF